MIPLQTLWSGLLELRRELIGGWRGASLHRPATIRTPPVLGADNVSGTESTAAPGKGASCDGVAIYAGTAGRALSSALSFVST